MIRITDKEVQQFEKEHIAALRSVGAECTLLLKSDGTFPMDHVCKLALYGSGARNTIKGGTGSGDVNVRHFVTVEEGLENAGFSIISKKWMDSYDALKKESYQIFVEQVRREAKELQVNPVMYGMGKAMPEPEYELPLDFSGGAAVYVLSRNSGEGADRSQVPGDIELSETEIRDILALDKAYTKFILVLNIGGMVNLKPVENVKNILLLSQLGTATGDVLADLLLGKSYPSGKLAMTWAPIQDYSSTEGFGGMDDTYYREGIYVGYRYFDTVRKIPAYPFGYGLSFTEFTLETQAFEADEEQIRVSVCVKNTGRFKGKEVVQIYASGPKGKLDKPHQELAAFVKTKELAPEETQELTITFATDSMASYDTEEAAYVMEPGNYIIRVGNSSQDTKVCGIVELDETVSIRRLKNICKGWEFEDLLPEYSDSYIDTDGVTVAVIRGGKMKQEIATYEAEPVEIPDQGKCLWDDVKSGRKSLDEFVGSLSVEQLVYLNIGLFHEDGGMGSIIGSASATVAGAAGETTWKLKDFGVPVLVMADGPAGLRLCTQYKVVDGEIKGMDNALANFMDFLEPEQLQMMASMTPKPSQEEVEAPVNYTYCSAIPIGTALAQSWNEEVAELCGSIVGDEMELFGIHLWLAPAMNIQRSPLCGRNFEYYSEDPLISGVMAAAVTKGVQSHKGCGVTIKHFACNNQETNRMVSNSVISERALREIYLKGFEICVKNSQPYAVMSSYNLINGEHTCNSKELLSDVLRDEWGYQGIVMTDWYAVDNTMVAASERQNRYKVGIPSGCVKAGNDIIMPGTPENKEQVLEALKREYGEYPIKKAELQRNAKRILKSISELT